MVGFEEIQAAYYMVAATGVLVAAIYYVMNLRMSRKNQELSLKTQEQTLETRQAQLFMNVYQRFGEPDLLGAWYEAMSCQWRDFDDFIAKYGQEANPAFWIKFLTLGTFFEGIGVLVKRGYIDATLVDDMMSMHIVTYWQKFEPIIMGFRRIWNSPTVNEYFETLYDAVYEIWRQQHPETLKPIISQ